MIIILTDITFKEWLVNGHNPILCYTLIGYVKKKQKKKVI